VVPISIPYWKGFLDLNYQLGGFQTGIKFNYIADVMDDNTGVIVESVERRVREWYTFDWRASYLFKKPEEVVAENGFTKEKGGYSKDGKAVPAACHNFQTKHLVASAGRHGAAGRGEQHLR
jgi:hypothetical protein